MIARTRRLSGWGRFPVAECAVARPSVAGELDTALAGSASIARGNGRAYGDAALNRESTIDLLRLDHMLAFDAASGLLTCEAGVLLRDVIDAFVPRGWFPTVVPGTALVSVGGAIAADVHGKNHHGAGSFCDHLAWLDLAIAPGETLRCSRSENPELFAATCGGMGLTGAIVRACFALRRIETAQIRQQTHRAADLGAAIEQFETTLGWTYSVAWIDCLASGASLGRSVMFLGEHADIGELPGVRRPDPLERPIRRARRVPLDFPQIALNTFSVRAFNALYHGLQRPGEALTGLDGYFFPLDAILDWNRIYGRRGFVQHQCLLPLASATEGLREILRTANGRGASFLAVLKRMGPASHGMLGFGAEGYTLALDFAVSRDTFALLDRLDAIVVAHGGRLYLAKDARMAPATFAAGYPRLAEFRAVRARYELDRRFASLQSRRLEI